MGSVDQLIVGYEPARHALGDVGRTTFHALINNGDLVRVKIGRRGFVTRKSLEDYVNRLSEAATA